MTRTVPKPSLLRTRRFANASSPTAGEGLTGLDGGRLRIREYRCTKVRNRNAGCHACADVCPSGCIVVEGVELVVDPLRCIGCCACASACPTAAIEAVWPGDSELMGRLAGALEPGGGTVVVSDNAGLDEGDGVVAVPSAARVDESLIVGLSARGASKIVVEHASTRTGDAEDPVLAHAQAAVDTSNAILRCWGVSTVVELRACVGKMRASNADDSVETGATNQVDPPARRLHVQADGTIPHHIPDKRERLLDTLAALGAPQGSLDCRLWARVSIDPAKCSSCRLCSTFCPTGALSRRQEKDGSIGLLHTLGECVRCGSCADVCPRGALTLQGTVNAADILAEDPVKIDLAPVAIPKGTPTSIIDTMRGVLGVSQLYER